MTQPVSTDSERMRMTGAAVATPVTANGSVDHARLAAHAQRLLAAGVDSLALFGTTGEGSSFDSGPNRRYRTLSCSGYRRAGDRHGRVDQRRRCGCRALP